MLRREAIKQIAILGSAMTLFPGCNLEEIPKYTKIPLERKQWNLLKHFAEAVLPVNYEAYPTTEPRAHFLLNILNDCTPTKSLDAFLQGFSELQTHLEQHKSSNLEKLNEEELDELFQYLESPEISEDLARFYQLVKDLAKQHFTGSERFMKEELDYRFIPGKYQGNVHVDAKN